LVVGAALLTPLLVLLAAAGSFRLAFLGASGWLGATIIGMVRCRQRPTRSRFDLAELAVVVAATAFCLIAASGRDESLGAGRDQQVYAEFAIALSERGTFDLRYAPLDSADRDLLRYGYRPEACTAPAFRTIHSERSEPRFVVPGGINGCEGVDHPIGLLHPSGWPVWLAIAHSIFGLEGLYNANAAIFAFGGLLFFLITRCVAGPVIGMAATLLLFALPSSLWISGMSLSEPLAMTLLLSLPLLAISGARARWPMAGIMLAAVLVRIDTAIAAPAVMAAALLGVLASSSSARIGAAREIIFTQGLAVTAAFLAYGLFFPRYFDATFDFIALVTSVSIALVLSAWKLAPAIAVPIGRLLNAPSTRLIVIAVLVLLFAYAAKIRPTLEPFGIIPAGLGLDGTRDFREESVRNLATYLSWPLVIIGLLGVAWSIWHRWWSRRRLFRPLLLVLGVAPALLYLWVPHIAPDHPWAFRRFLPIVVPYVILFAAVFVATCARRLGPAAPPAGALILLIPSVLLLGEFPRSAVLLRENDGLTTQIQAIARELPNELVVADGPQQEIASALFVAFGKPVAVAFGGLHVSGDPEQITKWIVSKEKIGHTAWLLHGPELWRTGAKFSEQSAWWITRKVLVPSTMPPAVTVETERSPVFLSRVEGLDRSFATRMFGGERAWGAREAGFFGSEIASFGMFRYTNGNAWLEVPAESLQGAEALKLDVFTYANEGARRWVRVVIDGQVSWTGDVGAGLATLRVPLTTRISGKVVRIQIQSQRADPLDLGTNNPRPQLAIGVVGIRPMHKGEPSLGRGMREFRSELTIVALPPGPTRIPANGDGNFVLDIRNSGTAYWPSRRELNADAGSVQIALRWYRRGKADELVADNRWPLLVSMLPGDWTKIRVPLRLASPNGQRLPPGEYEVRVDLVREPGSFFSDNADANLSIPVDVVR